MDTFELYFYDLTEDARRRYLDFYKMTEDEGNFDTFPIAIFNSYLEDNE